MGKLYKVGEYGEMKLGEFRKNIMQYTRNNLRSIISSSDPEIVEIAIDELTRRGEELKDGGRTGYAGGGGISQLDTGASDITYTGNEGPKSPQQIADEDFMLLEEYQKYVFEMQEQGLEPMSIEEFRQEAMSGMASNNRMQQRRQMVKNGGGIMNTNEGFEIQAGVKNYEPSNMVTVPKIAKSSPDTPTAKLAYITPEEENILIDLNLYGSLDGKPNRGPGGIPSLEGDFGSPTGQVSTSAGSFNEPGGSYGGAGRDVSDRRDTGTGDYQRVKEKDVEKARKERAKQINASKEAEARRRAAKIAEGQLERNRQEQEQQNAINRYNRQQAKKIATRKALFANKTMEELLEEEEKEKENLSALVDTGTGRYRIATPKKTKTGYDYNLVKDFVQGNLDYQDGRKPLGKDLRAAGASPLEVRNVRYRANLIDDFIDTRKDKLIQGLEQVGIKNAADLTDAQLKELFDNIDKGSLGSAVNLEDILSDSPNAGIFDKSKIRYRKDGIFDPTSPNFRRPPDFYTKTGNPFADVIFGRIGKAASGPVTTQGLEKLFNEYTNLQQGLSTKLEGGKYVPGDEIVLGDRGRDDLLKEFAPNRYAVENNLIYNPTTGTFTPDRGRGNDRMETTDYVPPSDPGDPGDPADPVIPVDPVTGQYSNEYLIPGGSNFYSNLPSTMFNPTTNMLTLANGGRANYAGGGIADLRQGYFLGKLVKKFTKPFKGITKSFKKILKSPLGKAAILYGLGSIPFGTTGATGFQRLGGMFASAGGGGNPVGGSSIADYFKDLAKTAFKPENAMSTITGISALGGLYTSYMNNKRQDETMEEYQRRLEEERGNFADIPVNFVNFADGGIADARTSALNELYDIEEQKLAAGGSAGYAPVTMQTEGNAAIVSGDDQSGAMAQGTTLPNQMPMMNPMMARGMNPMMARGMNPMMMRGMNPMMMRGMNPMMMRGMMGRGMPMMGGRMMAQEGGMMDMGGMEKDYRNEGGFVAIGGQERADDVPARLSKNEFVFTADAVRNAGGGDIDKGAEIMENMMENLEAGGKVSEESQGLQGARAMFATQKRLGEVL